MTSSTASSLRSSSSLSELPSSEASILTLPMELDIADLSTPKAGQAPLGPSAGLSSIMLLTLPFRDGMLTLRCVMIGELSGDDSANVEWCKFVLAREKSSPREWRGSDACGEA